MIASCSHRYPKTGTSQSGVIQPQMALKLVELPWILHSLYFNSLSTKTTCKFDHILQVTQSEITSHRIFKGLHLSVNIFPGKNIWVIVPLPVATVACEYCTTLIILLFACPRVPFVASAGPLYKSFQLEQGYPLYEEGLSQLSHFILSHIDLAASSYRALPSALL